MHGKRESSKKFSLLKVIENKNKDKRYVCKHVFSELTALCPTTALPDFYTVRLVYEPLERIIELKSLKIYFSQYRNVKIYHEELINEVLEDFVKVVCPNWVLIELRVNIRGGILTTIKRFWEKNGGDNIAKAIEGI